MDLLDNRFTVYAQKHFDARRGCSVTSAKTNGGHIAHVAAFPAVTPEVVAEYCAHHLDFMKKYPAHMGRKLLFVYDLRGAQYTEFTNILLPVVDLHRDCKEKYIRCLLCTIIVIDSECLRRLLNLVLSTMYTSSRPVKIMDINEDVRGTIASLWPKFRPTTATSA